MSNKKPIVTIVVGDRTYNIWADGRTEGFEDGDKPVKVINRIPQVMSSVFRQALENSWHAMRLAADVAEFMAGYERGDG